MTTPHSHPPASPASTETPEAEPYGLADLSSLPLSPEHQRLLETRCQDMLGSPAWRQRKRTEMREFIALVQIAPRLELCLIDMRTDLVTLVRLRETPVPCMAPGASDIHIERSALLVFEWPEEILRQPLPGTRCVRILEPSHVFHTNVAFGERVSPLCLGANIPRGFPFRELVMASYAALTLQSISLDIMDPAGVLNPGAGLHGLAAAQMGLGIKQNS